MRAQGLGSICVLVAMTGCGLVGNNGNGVASGLSASSTSTNGNDSGSGTSTSASGSSGSTSVHLVGSLSFSQQTGEITGYAYNQNNMSQAISVEFYINGPIGSGTYLGSSNANQVLIAGGNADGFTFQPSSGYVDSVPRKLYAYMVPSGSTTTTLMGGASVDYFAGADANGLAYFNANLSNTLATQCVNCHGNEWSNYYTTRGLLGDPSPLSGGTATNNTFYQYISNQGGGHPGGNQCSGNTLCTKVQTWFSMEFGAS